MISSSQFFEKEPFRINNKNRNFSKQLDYGPWGEQSQEEIDSRMMKNRIKKYHSINRYLNRSQQNQPSKLVLNHRTLSIRRYPDPPQNQQFRKLKFPKINDYDLTNKVKYCLNLDDNLNFISKSNKKPFKKLVIKPNYDFIKPRLDHYENISKTQKKSSYEVKYKNFIYYKS